MDLTGSRRNEKKTEVAILGVAISEPFLRRKEKGFENVVFLPLLKLRDGKLCFLVRIPLDLQIPPPSCPPQSPLVPDPVPPRARPSPPRALKIWCSRGLGRPSRPAVRGLPRVVFFCSGQIGPIHFRVLSEVQGKRARHSYVFITFEPA